MPYAASGVAVFARDVRGQGGRSEDVGRAFGNTLHGHIIRGLADKDPHKLFYRDVYLDTAQLAGIVSAPLNEATVSDCSLILLSAYSDASAQWLEKNADKVSSFCNDVVGDICGIVSGSTGAVISIKIVEIYNFNSLTVILIVMGLISSLTIGGKALEKGLAMKKSNDILYNLVRFLSIFSKK